jgi:hypothetical protein
MNALAAKRMVSVRVDPEVLRSARRSTGASSDSETINRALELAAELDESERFVRQWGGKGGAGAFGEITPRGRK